MAITILAAVLGLVIATACISIPQWVRYRRQKSGDDNAAQTYLRKTGRSARKIAQDNAALRAEQENEVRSQPPNSSSDV
jgi:hypothetical protein